MNDTVSATPKKMSVKTIAVIGVLTAVTCILAPLSIPIGDVPISLTNLVIYFGLYILGTRRETVSYIVYLLIGLVGVPVFSGFTAGPAKMFGPTGGYLIGFIPMAVIAGIFIEKSGPETGIGHDRHDSRNCCLLYLWNGMVCTGNENLCTGGVDNVRLSVYCI